MSPVPLWKINELLAKAENYPAEEREERLKIDCGADDELYAEVISYLRAKTDDSFLGKGPVPEGFLEDAAQEQSFASGTTDQILGREFHDYEVIEQVGGGGFGKVYRARHKKLGRDAALKLIHPQLNTDPKVLERFEEEARITFDLSHRNIVKTLDFFEQDDLYVMVMEYVEGQSLSEVLRNSKLSFEDAVKIAVEVAEGLAYAHEQEAKIIHRDIKPENILIPKNPNTPVKLVDFGIARLVEEFHENHRTEFGRVEGTMSYMSPEQARGAIAEVDHRTDIWSLGAVLYRMLTGNPPVAAKSLPDYIARVNKETPAPLSDFAPGLAPEIQRIIDKALAVEPPDRYRTIREMQADLRKFIGAGERDAAPTSKDALRKQLDEMFAAEDISVLLGSLTAHSPDRPQVPFDIRTIWGLDRGSFVGIATSPENVSLYEQLCLTERDLYETIVARDNPAALRPRIWVNVDFGLLPNGPPAAADVSRSLRIPNAVKSMFLAAQQFDTSFDLGFCFEIDVAGYPPTSGFIVQSWCRRLFREKIFGGREIAVIIHLKGANQYRLSKKAKTILKELRELAPGIGIEIMELQKDSEPAENSSGESFGLDSLFAPAGSCLLSWVRGVFEAAGEEFLRDTEELRQFNELFDFVRTTRADFQPNAPLPLAWQVVEELDKISPENDPGIDRQLLQLTEKILPHKLFELVRAYSESSREEALRQSLIFASNSDSLLDAWFGKGIDNFSKISLEDIVFKSTAAFIDNVVLGLLRAYRQGPHREKIKPIIDDIQPYLLFETGIPMLMRYCLDEITEQEFFEETDFQKLFFARRVGFDITRILERLKHTGIDHTDTWRIIALMSPNRILLNIFAELESFKRAVLGLCTSAEWEQMNLDKMLVNQILVCRFGRQLQFIN